MSFSRPENVHKILIIKLCCLGDILAMVPAIKALKATYPQAQIDFLATSWVEELAHLLPGITRCILWDEPYQNLGFAKKLLSCLKIVKTLRKEKYDMAFIGHRSRWFAILSTLSGIPHRAGFGNTVFLTHKTPYPVDLHETKRYLEIAKSLGVKDVSYTIELNPNSADDPLTLPSPSRGEGKGEGEQKNSSLSYVKQVSTTESRFGLDSKKSLIAIIPGGGSNPGISITIKRWEINKFAALCLKLSQNPDYQLLLLGSGADSALTSKILESLPQHHGQIINAAGETNFKDLIDIFRNARLAIGGDTGLSYLAAACGTPTLTLFGPTDPRLLAPLGPKHKYLWKAPQCSPCCDPVTIQDKSRRRDKEFVCWTKTHECMETLTVGDVEQAALEMLARTVS